MMYICHDLSSWILVLITLERLMCVTMPFKVKLIATKSRVSHFRFAIAPPELLLVRTRCA